VQIESANVLKL